MAKPPGCCKLCGEDFIRVNKLRKYCAACQAIRDISFRPHLKRDCQVCGTQFFPIKQSYTICGDCSTYEDKEKYGPCKDCGKHVRPAPGLAAYCIRCVQKSEKRRLAYKDTLVKRRQALVADRPVEVAQRNREAELQRWEEAENQIVLV